MQVGLWSWGADLGMAKGHAGMAVSGRVRRDDVAGEAGVSDWR